LYGEQITGAAADQTLSVTQWELLRVLGDPEALKRAKFYKTDNDVRKDITKEVLEKLGIDP
jgi:hypothetical protein